MRVVRQCDGAALAALVTTRYPGGPPVLSIEGEVFGPATDGYTLSEATLLERMELYRGGYELPRWIAPRDAKPHV
jgi:hypothetical protein